MFFILGSFLEDCCFLNRFGYDKINYIVIFNIERIFVVERMVFEQKLFLEVLLFQTPCLWILPGDNLAGNNQSD